MNGDNPSQMRMAGGDEEHSWIEYDIGISSDLGLRKTSSRRLPKSNQKRMDARRALYKVNPERKEN